MQLPRGLSADLSTLTDALQQPGVDLQASVQSLAASLRASIDSYLGLTVLLAREGVPICFDLMDDYPPDGQAATSLMLALGAFAEVEAATEIVFYATTPGAFVDLDADLSHELGVKAGAVVLDEHRTPAMTTGMAGLLDWSGLNQAVGILIEQGSPAATARSELDARAAGAGLSPPLAARELIEATARQLG